MEMRCMNKIFYTKKITVYENIIHNNRKYLISNIHDFPDNPSRFLLLFPISHFSFLCQCIVH